MIYANGTDWILYRFGEQIMHATDATSLRALLVDLAGQRAWVTQGHQERGRASESPTRVPVGSKRARSTTKARASRDERERPGMRDTDAVWRTIADEALADNRRWNNVGDLAHKAGVGEKLAYKAVARLAEIGAVSRLARGGFITADPERVVMVLSASRSLRGAKLTTLEAAREFLSESPKYAIGGTRAALHHIGGMNVIADHAPAIVYVPVSADLSTLPDGDEVLVFHALDRDLDAWVDGYTSKSQTYADLFAQPGWQASEFRRTLWRKWFTVDDWSRAEETA